MAETIKLAAEPRERAGKGAARSARRSGFVPGVIYGDKKEPVLINVDRIELNRILRDPYFQSHLYDVQVGPSSHHVMARDVQRDPVKDHALHVDFLRVTDRTEITVEVHVRFVGEDDSPGLKRGGVLNVVRHAVELVCRAGAIPDDLEADLTGLDIGDSIRVSALDLGEARPTITDRDFVIATVAAPSAVRAEAQEAQEAAEEEEEELGAEAPEEEAEEE